MYWCIFKLVSSSKEDNFRFSNCNNTDVPIYFKNITVRPDPLVILTEQWPINVTFDILVMKNITRMEVGFQGTSLVIDDKFLKMLIKVMT
ncbi:hypothetical protein DPMN_108043 [Dreissena polymorpha]|uniref:Uncharacterized protein n=1 Tax=Dreissena polymorpha TaxID=45954 RepID=A0A9D4K811_DREPO|nr:hypothetical protein DPMN_108043 [Dreissena polymorpha]